MKKWMNRLPSGFADVSDVTVSGTGTVYVAEADVRQKFDPSFSGTVEVGGGQAFNIVVDPLSNAVSGALVVPDAILGLPSACTVNVDFISASPLPKERVEYVLICCAGFKSPVDWAFVKGQDISDRWTFVQSENGVSLVFKPVGCRVILR